MSDEDNTLRIATDELSVELTGPAARVQQAYMALRHTLLESYEETLRGRSPSGGKNENGLADQTTPMYQTGAPAAPGSESGDASPGGPIDGEAVIQLVLRRETHTKVRLLERSELAESFVGRALEASAVRRLYTNPATARRLRDSITIGETVWRKLTPAGRREVAHGEAGSSEETHD